MWRDLSDPVVGHTCKTVSAIGPTVNRPDRESPVAVPSARIYMTYIFAFVTAGAVA